MRKSMTSAAFLLLTVFFFSPAVLAAKADANQGGPRPAVKACQGKSPGAKVQFKNRRGQMVHAVCRLVAVPVRMQQPGAGAGGSQPPQLRGSNKDDASGNQPQPPVQLQVR